MPPQVIRREQMRRPFIPFRLHVSDGSSYEVLDSHDIFVDMLQIEIGMEPDAASGLFTKTVRLAPNHITRIEPLTDLGTLIREN